MDIGKESPEPIQLPVPAYPQRQEPEQVPDSEPAQEPEREPEPA